MVMKCDFFDSPNFLEHSAKICEFTFRNFLTTSDHSTSVGHIPFTIYQKIRIEGMKMDYFNGDYYIDKSLVDLRSCKVYQKLICYNEQKKDIYSCGTLQDIHKSELAEVIVVFPDGKPETHYLAFIPQSNKDYVQFDEFAYFVKEVIYKNNGGIEIVLGLQFDKDKFWSTYI